jgi:hypothetical protein
MYTAIKATYEKGVLTFNEAPPPIEKSEVVVLFMDTDISETNMSKGVKLGSLAGKGYDIPSDFNAPLDLGRNSRLDKMRLAL